MLTDLLTMLTYINVSLFTFWVLRTSVTFGVRTSKDRKKYYNNILASIAETDVSIEKKPDALYKVFQTYEHKKDAIIETPFDITDVINQVDCTFLRYDAQEGFICNEFFHRKKKPNILGTNSERIIKSCADCKKGKELLRQREIEKQLQKDSIKKIIDFRKAFMEILDQGFTVEAYMCKGRLLHDNTIGLSIDGKHISCPLQKDKEILIQKVCFETINPITGKPPCRHFINLFHHVDISDIESVSDIERKFPQIDIPELEEPIKTIEVEAEVIESKDKDKEI